MKIGISADPYNSRYADNGRMMFSKLAGYGFSAVDYGMANTDSKLYMMSEAEQEKLMLSERAAAEAAGMEISQVHGPWRYPPRDFTPEDRRERMEKMKRSIFLTRLIGCKYWVVHPIMPYGTEDLKSGKAKETWDLNLEFMTELLEYAKTQDVTICLENMPMLDFSISTPSRISEFVKMMNDDNFKICLDTGHVAVFSDLSVGNVVRTLGKDIKVLHIHDNNGDRDAHLWPKSGIIDWTDAANALDEIGFNGVFSLETAPSNDLDDERFESETLKLLDIAKKITENSRHDS